MSEEDWKLGAVITGTSEGGVSFDVWIPKFVLYALIAGLVARGIYLAVGALR